MLARGQSRAEQGIMKSRRHRWVPLHRPGQRQSLETQAAERTAGLLALEPGNRKSLRPPLRTHCSHFIYGADPNEFESPGKKQIHMETTSVSREFVRLAVHEDL